MGEAGLRVSLCAEMDEAWRKSEVLQRIDVLAGFLASRYPGGGDEVGDEVCDAGGGGGAGGGSDSGDDGAVAARRRVAGTAAAARRALEGGDLDEAWRRVGDLESEAEDWADHPHFPPAPSRYEADAQVHDYAKDLARGFLSAKQRDDLKTIRLSLTVSRSRVLRLCHVTTRDRQDLDYVCGRISMSLDLGHVDAARRELARLREIDDRYRGKPCPAA
ncbi:hypothetical protein FGW37_32560 [Streptomyces rectiverticillatus]|uniref:hypothetical protein n=1 Tax=Streptomyces rectiverticillatus TaxID=173860 RepID=UPI0015C370DE|nr:hypothetical protein [Streptomyces rectiverticillatus]QLE75695.1 hypothetical protein FGW37_32560 [Streptomyces rectiverticillatus]